MSVIVAIKKNCRIYMAADTQSSCGEKKITLLGKDNRKIRQFDNGIIMAHSGTLHNWQLVAAHSEFFTLPEDGILTKQHIVQNIIPKLSKLYMENDMLSKEDGEPDKLKDSFILAHKDKLFQIDDVFDVTVIEHYVSIGSGSDLTYAGLIELDAEDIRDEGELEYRLIELLGISSDRIRSVSGPYYLIDTEKQTGKIVN